MQEEEGQGDEAEGEERAEEGNLGEVEVLRVVLRRVGRGRLTVTMVHPTDMIRQQCSGLEDSLAED